MDVSQRPPYDTVDFKALSKKDDHFKHIWQKSHGKLDFQHADTIKALSNAILKVDFGLQLDVPDDRLCPPIPNRWNYVTWTQSLIDSTSPSYSNKYDPSRPVTGLDIGTGASAIYAMLCLQSRPAWSMCATDIDKKSFDSAAHNLALNKLMTRCKLLQTTALSPIIPFTALGVSHLDFTICNPPFFTDAAEMQSSLEGGTKSWKPNAVCTGAEVEMVCPGGDLGFVTTMINESLVLQDKVQWYSSMLGKLDSAKAAINLLKKHGISNWAVGVIDTGGSTKRWVVAWSFGDLRPRNATARFTQIANESLPFPTLYTIPIRPGTSPHAAVEIIDSLLTPLDLRWTWDHDTSTGIAEARHNVWKRAYRREYERKKREVAENGGGGEMSLDEGEVQLVVRIRMVELAREVDVEWLRGRDQVMWESFCGLVHRVLK